MKNIKSEVDFNSIFIVGNVSMRKFFLVLSSFLLSLFSATKIFAVCPICTIAVGAGIGLAQWLGIDDTITGLWVGGLTVSLIVWTVTWLTKKNIRFFGRKPLIAIGYYALIILPLYYKGIIGHELNKLWGIDKLLLGIIVGSILFAGGTIWYEILKKHNGGKSHFRLQKILMPIAPLIIMSFVLYCITK